MGPENRMPFNRSQESIGSRSTNYLLRLLQLGIAQEQPTDTNNVVIRQL